MPNISIENGKFVLTDGDKTTELLNISDYKSNLGRLPMHSLGGGATLPSVLGDLMQSKAIFSDGDDNDYFMLLLTGIVFSSYIIKKSAPMNILEIGDDRLSYWLATLTGHINPDSRLECAVESTDTPIMNKLSSIQKPPHFSLTVTNFNKMNLPPDLYDIIIVNGRANFKEPYKVLKQAAQALKGDGTLICAVNNTPFLESSFKLLFDNRGEFAAAPSLKLLTADIKHNPSAKPPEFDIDRESKALYRRLLAMCGADSYELRPLVSELDKLAGYAARNFLSDKKSELIKIKRLALDYIIDKCEPSKERYLEALNAAVGT